MAPSGQVNIQDLLQEVGKRGYLPEGGLQSGRTQLYYEESGYFPGGDSDLATLALKASIPELVDLLNSSNDPEVLSKAARVLSLINSKAIPMMATSALEKLLEYESVDIHSNISSSEEHHGDISPEQQVRDAAVAALKCVMANTKDPQNRGFKVHDGINLPTPPTKTEIEIKVNELVSGWEWSSDCPQIDEFDQDEINEEFNLSALSRVGLLGQSAVNPLLKSLENNSPKIRIAVIRSLGRAGLTKEDDIKLLAACLEDSCIAVRNEAIITLGKFGVNAKLAINPLIGELANLDARIRSNTAEAIGNIGVETQTQIDLLCRHLADEDQYVRVKVAIALLKNQPDNKKIVDLVLNELLVDLKADHPKVRLMVTEDLGELERIPQDLMNLLIKSFTDKNENMELRLNAFFAIARFYKEESSTIQSLIKPFLLEVLKKHNPSRWFSINDEREALSSIGRFTDEGAATEEDRRKFSFYRSWPIDKRHAFFLAGIEPGSFPDFNQALREILMDKNNDIKARYNSAFILGFVENPSTPSRETVNTLKTIMDDSSEDFDIRWINAFSLIRVKQDVGNFFEKHHLPNPMQIDCKIDKFGEGILLFDPYFGWCEMSGSGGDGSRGWARVINRFFGGRRWR